MRCITLAFGALVLIAANSSAHAISFTLDFTATGLTVFGTGSPPTNPVTGVITYDAASLTAPIDSLTSINLTIDGHSYSVGETGFFNNGDNSWFGGLINGVTSLNAGTTDFVLSFDRVNLGFFKFFDYAVPEINTGFFRTSTFSDFNVTETTVTPLPASWPLFASGIGLVGLIGRLRKRRRAAAIA